MCVLTMSLFHFRLMKPETYHIGNLRVGLIMGFHVSINKDMVVIEKLQVTQAVCAASVRHQIDTE